jgi:hypothetical protein
VIGILRTLVPALDRRESDRFRDVRVKVALGTSERRLKTNRTLQRELRAVTIALSKEGSRQNESTR